MNKVTAPGWPDPTEWVTRLYQQMAERQTIYDAETDTLNKRNKAGAMLGLLMSSLLELPAFKNDSVHLPLKDLLIFLSDLDRGRDHPWSSPGHHFPVCRCSRQVEKTSEICYFFAQIDRSRLLAFANNRENLGAFLGAF